jgi:hypothetical protein
MTREPQAAGMSIECRSRVNGTGMRCSGWWHCCRSPPLVALIHQTTDRDAVQVSPSSGRRISTPILTGPERPGSCLSRRGLVFASWAGIPER